MPVTSSPALSAIAVSCWPQTSNDYLFRFLSALSFCTLSCSYCPSEIDPKRHSLHFSTMATENYSSPDKLKLKTEVGLLGGVSLIAGVMVGSGIFMSPQYVLIYIGSPGASLLIWAASGLLAMLASLCYAELGTVIRESGGEYIYILRTSGNIMAFICAFTNNIVLRPTSMIAVALIFAQNVLTPFYDDCPPPNGAVKCLAALGIMVLTVVNCFNVRSSITVTVLFTAMKVLALITIMIGGVVLLIQGDTANSLQNFFEGTKLSIRPMGIAFYQCLWSYDGWNTLNHVTEEINHPEVIMSSIFSTVTIVLHIK